MRGIPAAASGLFVLSLLPTALVAKGNTVKIILQGRGLANPVAITDPGVAEFAVWAGPGVRVNGIEETEGFIIDWKQGPVAEPPFGVPRYEVSFYVSGRVEGLAYMVFYAYDATAGRGFVYLPGKGDAWFPVNMAMYHGHGLEGRWFRATSAWDNLARSVLAVDAPGRKH